MKQKVLTACIYNNDITSSGFIFKYYMPMVKGFFGFKKLQTITNYEFPGYQNIRTAVEELIRYANSKNIILNIVNYNDSMDSKIKLNDFYFNKKTNIFTHTKTEYCSISKIITREKFFLKVHNSHNSKLLSLNLEQMIKEDTIIKEISYENENIGYEIDNKLILSV